MKRLLLESLEVRRVLDGSGTILPVPINSPVMTAIASTLFYLDSFSTTEQQTVISNVGEIEPEVGPARH